MATTPTTAGTTNSTSERILDGALRALSRRGVRKLSMSDICEEAGVSRGTLYRYFRSKVDVLEAIGQHVEKGFTEALREAVEAKPDPEQRLFVVLDVIVHYADAHPEAVLAIDEEPEFALAFLRREFPNFLAAASKALEPVLEACPAVQDNRLTKSQVAEIVLRVGMSAILIPSPQSPKLPKNFTRLWESLGGAAD